MASQIPIGLKSEFSHDSSSIKNALAITGPSGPVPVHRAPPRDSLSRIFHKECTPYLISPVTGSSTASHAVCTPLRHHRRNLIRTRASAHARSVTSRMQCPIRPVGSCHGNCARCGRMYRYMHMGILCHAPCVVWFPRDVDSQATPADDRRGHREEGQSQRGVWPLHQVSGHISPVGHPREQLRCYATRSTSLSVSRPS